jgi:hypothetical protein
LTLRVASDQRIHAGNYRKRLKGNPDDEARETTGPIRAEAQVPNRQHGRRRSGRYSHGGLLPRAVSGFLPGGGFIDWLEAEWQITAAVKYVTGGQNRLFPEACLHTNAQMVSLTDVVVYESTVKENAHVDTNDQKQTERKRRIAAD